MRFRLRLPKFRIEKQNDDLFFCWRVYTTPVCLFDITKYKFNNKKIF